MRRILLSSILLTASVGYSAEQTVWQIGKPDHSYAEFACAGNYQEMARRFNKPILFEPGRSDAAKDWPFIQPGPVDVWAAQRGQPWTIGFNLPEEPRGVFTLRIEFADVHKLIPPKYRVAIGSRDAVFQLAPGGGDESLGNPRAGKAQKIELALPAGFFQKGSNRIQLTVTDGSWVQYDAVTLRNDPDGKMPEPQIQSVSVVPTPYFIREQGKVRRAVDVAVVLTSPAPEVSLRVEVAGEVVQASLVALPQFGGTSREIGVPDSTEPIAVKVTAAVGKSVKTATATILPQRKWRIYVAPSSHTDIGYTDIQPVCAERHCHNADVAVELLRSFPDFRWNLEVAWQAENYLATRKGQKLEEFLQAARNGRIGIQALYCNILTGLCSHEAACRLTAYAAKLHRDYQIPYGSAMISDVPTQEASLPMILAGSGIRYFSSGINNDRAYNFTRMQERCPCWWEGPDGSRVLMMYMYGYAQASGWGLDQSLETARANILAQLQRYAGARTTRSTRSSSTERSATTSPSTPGWPKSARRGTSATSIPSSSLARTPISSRTSRKGTAANSRSFAAAPARTGRTGPARLPARRPWSARPTSRRPREKFLALADHIGGTKLTKPAEIYGVWRNCLLYDEHTWGPTVPSASRRASSPKHSGRSRPNMPSMRPKGPNRSSTTGRRPLPRWCERIRPHWWCSIRRVGRGATSSGYACRRERVLSSPACRSAPRARTRLSWSKTFQPADIAR